MEGGESNQHHEYTPLVEGSQGEWEGVIVGSQQDSPLVEPDSSHETAGLETTSSKGRGKR